jgi:hypothetical protein
VAERVGCDAEAAGDMNIIDAHQFGEVRCLAAEPSEVGRIDFVEVEHEAV